MAAPLLAACGGSSLDGDDAGGQDKGPIKIGLLLPQSGVYKSVGDDIGNGFNLYVKLNGGKLGGRKADLVYADEGEDAASGKAAYEKLAKQERVPVISGVVSSATMNAIKDLVEAGPIPLVGSNASPTALKGTKFIWRTSYVNEQPGVALGKYIAQQFSGQTVATIAADYAAGKDSVGGFVRTFTEAQGKLETQIWTPYTGVINFQPFLTTLKNSKAKAVYCFYAGGAANQFIKQYKDFGITLPLYAAGFLTEGPILTQVKPPELLKDIYTSMNYSADLDNAANRKFASEYQKAYNMQPTTYAMASYDAAAVLDKAIALAGDDVSPENINAKLGQVGQIDSPRGQWQFNADKCPLQKWYLRQVKLEGAVATNALVSELTTLG